MLVIVLLLLPVFLTGASLEVPGVRCEAYHCCACLPCHAHAICAGHQEGCLLHDHRHQQHHHGRILLLHDAGLRVGGNLAVLPAAPLVPRSAGGAPRASVKAAALLWSGPPLYSGHLNPLRC